ncbi:MAG TPA: HAD family phosphatase [Planctomycetota bacterium]|nr:HAD family phosphatase [Planctomycetota bacterium]
MTWQAVIFDMDGVLVDSEPLHFATTNVVLARRGAAIDRAFYDQRLGMPEVDFFRDVVDRLQLREAPEELARERIRESLDVLAGADLLPTDGALECLLLLRADGRKLGLATSAARAQLELIVERFALRSVLSALVAVEEVAHGKPAPDLFLEAARRLSVAPEECIVVEDAVHGVRAARAAGMAALALPGPGHDGSAHRAAGALASLSSLRELTPELLDSLGTPES